LKEIEYEKNQVRSPASPMPAGSVGSRDASVPIAEFGADVNPLLGERLQGYATRLKEAADKTKRAAEIEEEIAKLKSQGS
jgi:hypothetical protein